VKHAGPPARYHITKTYRKPGNVPKIVDRYMQGKIEIDSMITHVMPLAEINNAFELMKRGESIRGVVTF
jgi:S-(hydroxymethyl)glutathione dehydrogenase / alcohol dehydrogenase